MAEQSAGFDWSQRSRLAAELVAEGELTDAEIAAKAGIGPRTLYRWKRNPVFIAEVERRVEVFGEFVRSRGIARLARRIDALNDRWERMKQMIDERAADPAMADVPGGTTGLLVHRVKGVGRVVIEWYEVDVRLLREFREPEKHAAQRLGQLGEKPDPMSEAKPAKIRIVEVVRPAGYWTEGGVTSRKSLEQSVTVEMQVEGETSGSTAATPDSAALAAR